MLIAALPVVVGGMAAPATAGPTSNSSVCTSDTADTSDTAISASALPAGFDLAECDIRGRTVVGPRGVAAVVPRDRRAVHASAEFTDGLAALTIEVDKAGKVRVSTSDRRVAGDEPSRRGTRSARGSAGIPACEDGAYQLLGPALSDPTIRFHYWDGSRAETGLDFITALQSLQRATGIWVAGANDCGEERKPDLSNAALPGNISPNIAADATCGLPDNEPALGFLPLQDSDSGLMGVTCRWPADPDATATTESDIAVKTRDRLWWSGNGACPSPDHFDIVSAMTHEIGHYLGLDHPAGPDHDELTMGPPLPCSLHQRTLGLGDFNGIVDLYGASRPDPNS